MKQTQSLITLSFVCFFVSIAGALDFPGPDPGPALVERPNGDWALSNAVISCVWKLSDGKIHPVCVVDRLSQRKLDLKGADLFSLILTDGRTLASSDMKVTRGPVISELEPEPEESNLNRRFPGRQLAALLVSPDKNLVLSWRAILRDGANAARQEFEMQTRDKELAIKEIQLVDLPADRTQAAGTVPGSPITAGNLFFAYEHPNAVIITSDGRTRCGLEMNIALKPGEVILQTCAAGAAPEGQRRRGFLYYIERERAHPYRPFLHYNAWYDLCWGGKKIDEAECLNAVESFGRELTEKRGVALASYVWDDGWDDPKTLWRAIKENFPNGFTKILAAAQRYKSTLGFWLSPFGGYGDAAKDRYAYGRKEGFEFKKDKFALAGPKYYGRFLETCLGMIDKNGANFFKFDGLTQDVYETEAMLRLTRELRERKPDLFISITTGTWPSPYWLWFGDSTWRGGGDMGFYGEGSKREQWITYRDMITFRQVVRPAPLYPLNSLMNQGIAHARFGTASECGDSREEFRQEIQSFFACGTCLQELYITPAMMKPENWDDLAEAAKWSQANADVLVDVHWIGGDPGEGQPYGWASWSKRKGIIALRNPASKTQTAAVDIGQGFELPSDAPVKYTLKSPWKMDSEKPSIVLSAGAPHRFDLAPFEVLVFDAVPDAAGK